MKKSLQLIALLLIAIFGFTSLQAQAVKFHAKEPPTVLQNYIQTVIGTDKDGNDIVNTDFQVSASGTLYGCGNASSVTAFLLAEGTCTTTCNNGGSDPGPVPGQTNFVLQSETKTFDATNGHAFFDLSATQTGSCKGNGNDWFHTVTDVTITKLTIVVNGVPVDLTKFLQ
jgi:hypothetical protein